MFVVEVDDLGHGGAEDLDAGAFSGGRGGDKCGFLHFLKLFEGGGDLGAKGPFQGILELEVCGFGEGDGVALCREVLGEEVGVVQRK